MPALALALRTVLDLDIPHFNDIWSISAALFLALAGILFTGESGFSFKTKNQRGSAISTLLFLYVYALTACLMVNCLFDKSIPQKYTVTVTEKRKEFNKSMDYYLTVSPWGPVTAICEESVLKTVYDKVKPGDKVVVYYRKELLTASWYSIHLK